MSNYLMYILECLHDIQLFLATTLSEKYFCDITNQERTTLLNQLLSIEKNIRSEEKNNDENI